MRRIAGNLLVLILAVALPTAIGEAALRSFVSVPLPRVEPEVRYQHHPVRRFTLRPNQQAYSYGEPASIGRLGFRLNSSEEQGGAQAPTIFALGDSFTFGLGVGDGDTWPAQLESGMRAQLGRPLSVINGGTISYGVFQELDLLKSAGLPLRPTVLVHGLYWNDFMNPEPPAPDDPIVVTADGHLVWDQPAPLATTRQKITASLSRSALFFTLKQALGQFRQGGGTSAYSRAYSAMLDHGLTAQDWKPIEAFYRDLLALGEASGFATFVIIMPINDVVAKANAHDHPYAVEARRRLDAVGIPYLDSFQLWSQAGHGVRPFLPQGVDAHLNAEGYRILAEASAPKMLAAPQIAERLR
jgi:lysophospholipase L1-like esterase